MLKPSLLTIAMLRCVHNHVYPVWVTKMIYVTYVYPFICYCLSIWGNAADVHVNRVLVIYSIMVSFLLSYLVRANTSGVDACNYYLPRIRTAFRKRSVVYCSVIVWNMLPANVKLANSVLVL